MSNLLKRSIHLDQNDVMDTDLLTSKTTVQNLEAVAYKTGDYKKDRQFMKLRDKLVSYFEKYPTFKDALLTIDHIQKVCLVCERHCFKKGIDKKALVLNAIEIIKGSMLSAEEKDLIGNSIEFLHRSKLIDISIYKKMWYYFCSFFR